MRGYKKIAIFAYYAAYSLFYCFLLLHKSEHPLIFRYSFRYLIYLGNMALLFLLPYLLGKIKKYLSVIAAGMLISYFAASNFYYYTQRHLFDPFLQVPNIKFDQSAAKGKNTYRILCLGGSTTRGVGLKPDQKYPYLLQDILQMEYPALKIEVFNGASGWYTSKHSLISYVTYYRYWDPDMVIVMHAINDLARSFSPQDFAIGGYRDSWSHYYGPSINGAKPPQFERLIFQKYLWKIIEPALRPFLSLCGKKRANSIDYPLERFVSVKMLERHLSALVKCVKQDKAGIILIAEPSLYKTDMNDAEKQKLWFGRMFCSKSIGFGQVEYPSYPSLYRAMGMYNDTIKEVAIKENIKFIDADGRIPKDLRYFTDDCHYTYEGSQLLANIIAEAIIGAGYIKD